MCNGVCVSVITGPWGSAAVWIDRLAPDSRSWAGRCRCVHMHRQEHLRRGVCLRQITGYTWRYVWEHSHPQTRPLEYKIRGEQAEKTWLLGLLPHFHPTHTPRPTHARTHTHTQTHTTTHPRTHTHTQTERDNTVSMFYYRLEVTCSGDFYVSILSQLFLIKILRKKLNNYKQMSPLLMVQYSSDCSILEIMWWE